MKNKKNVQQFREEIKLIKEMFNKSEAIIKSESPLLLEEQNYSPLVIKRRIAASRKYLEKANTLFASQYADRQGCMPLLNWYIGIATTGHQGTRCIDDVYFPLLGAAIWVLDYCKEYNLLDDLCSILPAEYDSIEMYGMPYVDDSIHSENLISSIVTVIMERKQEYKDVFEKIMKMIDRKDINQLEKQYEQNVFDFISLYLGVAVENEKRKDEKIDKLMEDYSKKYDALLEMHPYPTLPLPALIPMNFPIRTEAFSKDLLSIAQSITSDITNQDADVDMIQMVQEYLFAIEMEEERLINEICKYEGDFLCDSPYALNQSYDTLKEKYGEDTAHKLHNFGKGNPYEICAAYLFLTYKDDDLLYLTIPSAATLFYGVCRLPWNNKVVKENDDVSMVPTNYDLIYKNTENPEDAIMQNNQQLLFSIRNQIMPRKLEEIEPGSKIDMSFDVPRETVERMYSLSSVLELLKDRWDDQLYDEIYEDNEGAEDEQEQVQAQEKTIEDLEIQNEALTQKLKKMQSFLNEERQKVSQLEKNFIQQQNQFNAEHEELISLREALFCFRNGEPEEIIRTQIAFPCETSRNICVFGGHDTWIKSMRPLLPNVKFIGREINPHPDLIKNADVVWLQTNCMSHAHFNQIINVARRYNVNCKYFKYAGAQKCAEQILVEE